MFQAEDILRLWAVPALQNDYGIDPGVTGMWDATMTKVGDTRMSCKPSD